MPPAPVPLPHPWNRTVESLPIPSTPVQTPRHPCPYKVRCLKKIHCNSEQRNRTRPTRSKTSPGCHSRYVPTVVPRLRWKYEPWTSRISVPVHLILPPGEPAGEKKSFSSGSPGPGSTYNPSPPGRESPPRSVPAGSPVPGSARTSLLLYSRTPPRQYPPR